MVGWHHLLDGQEFEQTLGDGGGQESLACCSPRGRKESDTAERLNINCEIPHRLAEGTRAVPHSPPLPSFPSKAALGLEAHWFYFLAAIIIVDRHIPCRKQSAHNPVCLLTVIQRSTTTPILQTVEPGAQGSHIKGTRTKTQVCHITKPPVFQLQHPDFPSAQEKFPLNWECKLV